MAIYKRLTSLCLFVVQAYKVIHINKMAPIKAPLFNISNSMLYNYIHYN